MRNFVLLSTILAVIVFLYKWRYRIINTLFAISFLRKLVVSFVMNIPGLKSHFIGDFLKQSNQS